MAEKKDEMETEKSIEIVNNNEKVIAHKQNKQLQWIFFLMIGIVLILLIVPYIMIHFFNTFEYGKLEFQKTKLGDLVFYSTKFPVIGLTGAVVGEYAVNFRNDPRTLDYIPVTILNNTIQFVRDGNKFSPVYITLNPYMKMCEDSVISMAGLSRFLSDSNLNVRSAYSDIEYAKNNNATFRWCDSSQFDTVIVVTDGKETSITEIDPHCYKIQFKDCEILQASEKFQLKILADYAETFKR